VVQRLEPPLLLVPLKHGELGDPQQGVSAGWDEVQGAREELAHAVQGLVDQRGGAGCKQQQVALVFGARVAWRMDGQCVCVRGGGPDREGRGHDKQELPAT
jgi:hypothetical protein